MAASPLFNVQTKYTVAADTPVYALSCLFCRLISPSYAPRRFHGGDELWTCVDALGNRLTVKEAAIGSVSMVGITLGAAVRGCVPPQHSHFFGTLRLLFSQVSIAAVAVALLWGGVYSVVCDIMMTDDIRRWLYAGVVHALVQGLPFAASAFAFPQLRRDKLLIISFAVLALCALGTNIAFGAMEQYGDGFLQSGLLHPRLGVLGLVRRAVESRASARILCSLRVSLLPRAAVSHWHLHQCLVSFRSDSARCPQLVVFAAAEVE